MVCLGTEADNSSGAVTLPELLQGLYAGDLETILLVVATAADENLLPCTSPDEEGRILAFVERLSELDALLPRGPDRIG